MDWWNTALKRYYRWDEKLTPLLLSTETINKHLLILIYTQHLSKYLFWTSCIISEDSSALEIESSVSQVISCLSITQSEMGIMGQPWCDKWKNSFLSHYWHLCLCWRQYWDPFAKWIFQTLIVDNAGWDTRCSKPVHHVHSANSAIKFIDFDFLVEAVHL